MIQPRFRLVHSEITTDAPKRHGPCALRRACPELANRALLRTPPTRGRLRQCAPLKSTGGRRQFAIPSFRRPHVNVDTPRRNQRTFVSRRSAATSPKGVGSLRGKTGNLGTICREPSGQRESPSTMARSSVATAWFTGYPGSRSPATSAKRRGEPASTCWLDLMRPNDRQASLPPLRDPRSRTCSTRADGWPEPAGTISGAPRPLFSRRRFAGGGEG